MLLFLDIVTTAAILFIVSIGLLAIFGVLKIINFAHGGWLTIGAYCAVVAVKLGLNPWAGLPIAFVAGAILGGVAELLIIRPLYRRPLDAILATWGLGIVIGQLITLAFGRDVQLIPNLMSGTVRVLSVDYSVYRLFMLFAALAIGLLFALTIEGTRLGLSARAVIMNETLARSLGIDTDRVRLATFMVGAGLAALAGVLLDAADQRRSEHGRGLAHRRVHAGHGRGYLLPRAGDRLPRIRRRAGAGQHIHQPRAWRHFHRGAGGAGAADKSAGFLACLRTRPSLPSVPRARLLLNGGPRRRRLWPARWLSGPPRLCWAHSRSTFLSGRCSTPRSR